LLASAHAASFSRTIANFFLDVAAFFDAVAAAKMVDVHVMFVAIVVICFAWSMQAKNSTSSVSRFCFPHKM
jgi:hypothetical protein